MHRRYEQAGPSDRRRRTDRPVRETGQENGQAGPGDRPGERRQAMPRAEKRVKVTLACDVCKRRNYITMKNRQNDRERIEMKKYCRWDRQHTLHRETR